jgi:hypothetical protein
VYKVKFYQGSEIANISGRLHFAVAALEVGGLNADSFSKN